MIYFGGWQKFSMIDFPGKTSAVLFTQGCQFRCPFCHNPDLINSSNKTTPLIKKEEIINFLKTRIGKLDGVVITGGEPTLHTGLINFLSDIKKMGFLIKLDTNGSNPQAIIEALEKKLIDYIAMDYKSPLAKYQLTTNSKIDIKLIKNSIEIIMNSDIPYEFRTTITKKQLSKEDLLKIGQELKGAQKYVLQKFIPTQTLNPEFLNATTYTDDEFDTLTKELKQFVVQCLWR